MVAPSDLLLDSDRNLNVVYCLANRKFVGLLFYVQIASWTLKKNYNLLLKF